MRTVRGLLLIAGVSVLLASALYAVSRGSRLGVRFDHAAVSRGFRDGASPRIHELTSQLVRTLDLGSLLLLGSGIVAVALVRRRTDLALAAVALLLGANLTTGVLKPLLGRLELFHEPGKALIRASYPSGHATLAMSLGLALVIVIPPSMRSLAALVGAAYAAAVGASLVALGEHYPSDVAGGYLVVGAWAAVVAATLSAAPRRSRDARPARALAVPPAVAVGGPLLLAAAFVSLVGLSLSRRPELLAPLTLHAPFVAAAGGLAVLAVVLFGAVAILL